MLFQSTDPGAGAESHPTARNDTDSARLYWILLMLAFAASLAVRWSFLGERWINPDEGAHLMDAWLVLRGFIPKVDYATRQPLYVYALAGVLKFFGATLTAGRLLPLACSLLTGLVIYFLGSELIDRRAGLLASVTYLWLPLEMLQSVVVKTEAPVTLLVVLSIYAAVAGQRRQRAYLFAVSGIVAGIGYYVRETALLVPIVVTVFLLVSGAGRWRGVLRSVGLFCAGYATIVLMTVLYYSPHLSPGQLWDLSPGAFLVNSLGRSAGPDVANQVTASWEGYGEPTHLYLNYLKDAFALHSFLFVGMILALFTLLRRSPEDACMRASLRRDRIAFAVTYSWLGVLGIMYVQRYLNRGFFIDYFREFLPPLVLLLALWLCRAVPALRKDGNAVKLVAAALPAGAAWYLMQARFPDQIGLGHHATLATALFAMSIVAFSRRSRRSRWYVTVLLAAVAFWVVVSRLALDSLASGIVPSAIAAAVLFMIMAGWYRSGQEDVIGKMVQFACLSLAVVAFAISLSYSALRLHVAYEAVWPQEEARRIADVISRSSDTGAEVLSGAVIWEFMAGRPPFQLISHPLGLKKQASSSDRMRLRSSLAEDPPEIVVMDGYTEKTYSRNVPFLDSLVQQKYARIATSHEGFRPVSVFRLIGSGAEDAPGRVE